MKKKIEISIDDLFDFLSICKVKVNIKKIAEKYGISYATLKSFMHRHRLSIKENKHLRDILKYCLGKQKNKTN